MVVKRNTKQREEVRRALAAHGGFVSAQDLHFSLRDQGSTTSLATVYRNLSSLVEDGEADTLKSPDGENLFRLCKDTGHHHHLICRDCGQAKEIAASRVEKWARETAAEYGYEEAEHVIDIFGVCSSCTAKKASGE